MPLKPEWEVRLEEACTRAFKIAWMDGKQAKLIERIADAFRPLLLELEAAVRRDALEEAATTIYDKCVPDDLSEEALGKAGIVLECMDAIRALLEPATEEN